MWAGSGCCGEKGAGLRKREGEEWAAGVCWAKRGEEKEVAGWATSGFGLGAGFGFSFYFYFPISN